MPRIYSAGPMQVLWPYCFFTMVIVLNQFINLQEPSGMLTSKIKSRSFHQFTEEDIDGKWKNVGKKSLPLPTKSAIKEGVQKTSYTLVSDLRWRKNYNCGLIGVTHHKMLLCMSLARVGPFISLNYKCNPRCVHFHDPLILKTFSCVFGHFSRLC